MPINIERIQLLINLARDGARGEVEREFVGVMAEGFSQMFGQQAEKANAEQQAKIQAEIDARIEAEVKIREEVIRKELLEMKDHSEGSGGANGKVKT